MFSENTAANQSVKFTFRLFCLNIIASVLNAVCVCSNTHLLRQSEYSSYLASSAAWQILLAIVTTVILLTKSCK